MCFKNNPGCSCCRYYQIGVLHPSAYSSKYRLVRANNQGQTTQLSSWVFESNAALEILDISARHIYLHEKSAGSYKIHKLETSTADVVWTKTNLEVGLAAGESVSAMTYSATDVGIVLTGDSKLVELDIDGDVVFTSENTYEGIRINLEGMYQETFSGGDDIIEGGLMPLYIFGYADGNKNRYLYGYYHTFFSTSGPVRRTHEQLYECDASKNYHVRTEFDEYKHDVKNIFRSIELEYAAHPDGGFVLSQVGKRAERSVEVNDIIENNNYTFDFYETAGSGSCSPGPSVNEDYPEDTYQVSSNFALWDNPSQPTLFHSANQWGKFSYSVSLLAVKFPGGNAIGTGSIRFAQKVGSFSKDVLTGATRDTGVFPQTLTYSQAGFYPCANSSHRHHEDMNSRFNRHVDVLVIRNAQDDLFNELEIRFTNEGEGGAETVDGRITKPYPTLYGRYMIAGSHLSVDGISLTEPELPSVNFVGDQSKIDDQPQVMDDALNNRRLNVPAIQDRFGPGNGRGAELIEPNGISNGQRAEFVVPLKDGLT